MKSTASTPSEYITQLSEDRKGPLQNLRQTILEHLDPKFQECISYGMLGMWCHLQSIQMATIAIQRCHCRL